MITLQNFVVVTADASPTSYGLTLETCLSQNKEVTGVLDCKGDSVWLNAVYKVKSFKEEAGERIYVLQEIGT